MLKMMGAVLIILATTLIGFYCAQRLKERTEQIRALQMVLQMLETEIMYGSSPLAHAFLQISQKNEGLISLLFARTSQYLEEWDGVSTFECWQAALDEIQPKLSLKKTELEWLHHFGQIIGSSDRLDQTKHIQLLMAHLKKIEVEATEEQKRSEKMYKTLGFLSGVLLVILMI